MLDERTQGVLDFILMSLLPVYNLYLENLHGLKVDMHHLHPRYLLQLQGKIRQRMMHLYPPSITNSIDFLPNKKGCHLTYNASLHVKVRFERSVRKSQSCSGEFWTNLVAAVPKDRIRNEKVFFPQGNLWFFSCKFFFDTFELCITPF